MHTCMMASNNQTTHILDLCTYYMATLLSFLRLYNIMFRGKAKLKLFSSV